MRDRYVDGEALRRLRFERQMRQKELAERAEVGATTLCKIESNRECCSDLLAYRLAAALGVSVEAFTLPGRRPLVVDEGNQAAA